MTTPRFAARLNAFKLGLPGKPGLEAVVARAAQVPGLDAADLNYPDHFAGLTPLEAKAVLDRHGIALNGIAMRYYTHPGYRLGVRLDRSPFITTRIASTLWRAGQRQGCPPTDRSAVAGSAGLGGLRRAAHAGYDWRLTPRC